MIVDIAVRLDYALEGTSSLLLQIEAAALPDQRILDANISVREPSYFARVPAEEGLGERCWIEATGRFECSYQARVEVDRASADLASLAQAPLHQLPGDVVKYLMDSRFIPAEKFKHFVETEFEGLDGGARIAAIRDWVQGSFDYVPGASNALTTAADSFVTRQGVCRDYAQVLTGLARAAGVPARLCSAYAPGVDPQDFHAVTEVWLGGAWHLLDATGMAGPAEIVRVGVGRDAADIPFLMVFGKTVLNEQSVSVAVPADQDPAKATA